MPIFVGILTAVRQYSYTMNLTARRLAPVLTSFFIINISAAAQGTAPAAGYTDAPYLRYEAEPGRCSGNAEFLTPPQPYSQAPLQAEASNQTAAMLRDRGDRVEWTAGADADAMTVRFSIPDGSDGKGSKASLALYVNGSRLTDIALDSYLAWQYIPLSNGT